MSDIQPQQRDPMTIFQQAELVEYLASLCTNADGSTAPQSTIQLNKQQADDLHALAARLYRMAPCEREIRNIVTGRR